MSRFNTAQPFQPPLTPTYSRTKIFRSLSAAAAAEHSSISKSKVSRVPHPKSGGKDDRLVEFKSAIRRENQNLELQITVFK